MPGCHVCVILSYMPCGLLTNAFFWPGTIFPLKLYFITCEKKHLICCEKQREINNNN